MKILYVVHQFSPYIFSGVEIYTYDLAKEMLKRENDVCVVSMPHMHDYKFPEYSYSKERFDFIKIKDRKNHSREFKNILRDFRPDIVHFQHLQYFTPRIIEITKSLNIPTVLHLRDYFYICERIRLLTKDGKICRSSKNCPGCKERRLRWKKHIESVDLIFANSHFTRDVYIRNGFNPEKIVVNYNGVNTKRVSKIKYSKSNILRFGFLSTVIKEKGVDVLIDVFNKLDAPASLEIWGRGAFYNSNLLKRVKNTCIEIRGEYTPFNIKDILSDLDIVVIPSIWPECWCNVKMEALVAGLGVLASSIGGIPEGIGDNKVLFFKPNNVASLLSAVKSMIANKDFWRAKKGYGYHVKTIREDARKMESIYTQLLSRYAKLSKRELSNHKSYIANARYINWNYSQEGVGIYRFDGKWELIYILRDVGLRFWELFTGFKPFDEIVRMISLEYNVCEKEAKRDLRTFMKDLQRERIIVEADKEQI